MVRNGGSYSFSTYRELETSDPNTEDFMFYNTDPKEMQWVANVDTSELKKHTNVGDFTLSFAADGSVMLEDSAQYGISAAIAGVVAWAMMM